MTHTTTEYIEGKIDKLKDYSWFHNESCPCLRDEPDECDCGAWRSIEELLRSFAHDLVAETRKDVMREVEKRIPKESHINYHIKDGIEYRDQNDIGISLSWEKGYNQALSDVLAVIRGEKRRV